MRTGKTVSIALLLLFTPPLSVLALRARASRSPGAAASGQATELHSAERRAIEQLLRDQQEAWNHGDIDRFLAGYWHSPELTFSGTGAIERGWDAVLARYKRKYATRTAMGQLDFSALEFRFLAPDAALVLGRWHLTRPPDNDIGGVFSLVLQKFPEGWRIIHDHSNAAAAPQEKK